MNAKEQYKLRAELKGLGVPSKSIRLLQVLQANPGLTTTALGEIVGITKQAVSQQVTPLEQGGVLANNHPHPLYKSWTISNSRVSDIITALSNP